MGTHRKGAEKAAKGVKTTVELSEELWRTAKVRAMDERSDLRSVIIAALQAYLKYRSPRQEG